MDPRWIRYTHDTIAGDFRDGTTLTETFYDLLHGIDPEDIRIFVFNVLLSCTWAWIAIIHVMSYQGKWYSLNNRRLFVFKHCRGVGMESVMSIPVQIIPWNPRRVTTKNDGESVKIRGRSQKKAIYGYTSTVENSVYTFSACNHSKTQWHFCQPILLVVVGTKFIYGHDIGQVRLREKQNPST